jgi:hypothetical protein
MKTTFSNIADFQSAMKSDTSLQEAFKNDPVEASKSLQDSPLTNDAWIYRIVVLALGISIVAIIIGVLLLIDREEITNDKSVPTILTAIGSAAIGALSGLLAPSPKSTKQ